MRLVAALLHHFGTSRLTDIRQEQLDRAYAALLRPGAAPATRLRNVLTPLRAILEHAARRGWCDRPAFEVPRQPKPRVAWLRPEEATRLVEAAAPHLRPLLVFMIATAARVSEALELDWGDVDLAAGRVTFRRTKAGVERWVDLVGAARAALAALPHRDGRVFRPVYPRRRLPGEQGPQWRVGEAYRDNGRDGGGQAKRALEGARRRAGLPGLRLHDLRHTAATWHYAIHRDLLRLQHFGGWANLSQVQIYAHLMPEIHSDAARARLSGEPAARVAVPA